MRECTICGTAFTPCRNAKTCSPKCSVIRTARRQRAYQVAHPEVVKRARKKFRDEMVLINSRRMSAQIDRAVKILFQLT